MAATLFVGLCVAFFIAGPSYAQEPGAADPAEAAAASAEAPVENPPQQKNYLQWMIESSGPIGAVLFLMSFIAVALIVKFAVELRRGTAIPADLVTAFDQMVSNKQYREAFDLVAEEDSYLGRVLAAGMQKVSEGHDSAVEAMQEAGEDEAMRIEHRLSWLAILGTTGPLLGLLGTVEGIIASFRVIATSDTQPKPSLLAEGISTSLFNTFEGLLVAVIATVAFMLFKNQAARLSLEVAKASERLMARFKGVPPLAPLAAQ